MLVAIVATAVAALVVTGCSDPVEPTRAATADTTTTITSTTQAPTTTEPPSTTLDDAEAPLFEPLYADPTLDPEAQVEAAYHHHWDILLDASRHGRTDYLHLAYTGEALEMRTAEIEQLIANGMRFGGEVEHNYVITIRSETEAVVMDGYWNHLFTRDAATGKALSEATGGQELHEFVMVKEDNRWQVAYVVVHSFS